LDLRKVAQTQGALQVVDLILILIHYFTK